MLLRIFVFFTLAGAAAAAAAEPGRQPTQKWIVNFEGSQCIASRAYGTEESPLHLVLKAPPVGEVMQLAVLRKAGRLPADQLPSTIGIGDRPPIKTNMLRYTPTSGGLRVHTLNIPTADFAPAREAKTLSIRSGGLNETFALSKMEPVLRLLDECVADLRKVWNVTNSDAEQSLLPTRASAALHRLFSSHDYPATALQQMEQGVVRFAILIDETGKVADCTVIQTSGVAVLDAQTCVVIMKRAKFEPARGADGKPAKDAVIQQITWKLNG